MEDFIRRIEQERGTQSFVEWVTLDLAPSRVHDAEFKQWFARELVYGASPSSAVALEKNVCRNRRPSCAVRCACVLRDQARELGLEMRAGFHSGECIMREADIHGIGVHIASRVCELARAGEVLVSGTVRDLSIGSDVLFRDRGTQTLKGVEGNWRIYSVETS